MDKQRFFDNYSRDLARFCPQYQDKYLCPICMRVFGPEALTDSNLADDQRLTDGHVWPAGLDGIVDSESIKQHRVLLCRRCNSTAGTRGDAHIQTLEKVRTSEANGILLGDQKVQIVIGPDRSVTVRAQDMMVDPKNKRARFTLPGKRNNPAHLKEFRSFVDSDEDVGVVIQNAKPYSTHHAKAGWVAAAYLFSFWTLGYRYILHPSLAVVRSYILESLDEYNKDCEVPLPEQPDLITFIPEDIARLSTPRIEFVLHLNTAIPHLEIQMLDYVVRLPFEATDEMKQIVDRAIQQGVPEGKDALFITSSCSRVISANCVWDALLEAPPC